MSESILEIQQLNIDLVDRPQVTQRLVENVSFSLEAGEVLGLVGESGCGKSLTCLSILGLLPGKTFKSSGVIRFENQNILEASPAELRDIRGAKISMIFQDPMSSLNPVVQVGKQVAEVMFLHTSLTRRQVYMKVLELFERVKLSDPESVYKLYPFQMSGGMQQRIMIAQALINQPNILIADEPTTALDVTVQAEVLSLMNDLQKDLGMAMILVTHNLHLVANYCDRVIVMYAGQLVEESETSKFMMDAKHPYTKALIETIPNIKIKNQKLKPLLGQVERSFAQHEYCRFSNRCPNVMEHCSQVKAQTHFFGDHKVVCNLFGAHRK